MGGGTAGGAAVAVVSSGTAGGAVAAAIATQEPLFCSNRGPFAAKAILQEEGRGPGSHQ